MNQLFGLLILSLAQGDPKEQAPQQAVTLTDSASVAFESQFGSECDQNYDNWPDGWKRQFGPDHPRYIEVELGSPDAFSAAESERKLESGLFTVVDHSPAPANLPQGGCLLAKLNGGNITIRSPEIEASSTFAYSFEMYVRTEAMRQSRVEVSLCFLSDETPRRVLERVVAAPIGRTNGWKKVELSQISPRDSETRYVRIELAVKSDLRHDLSGLVAFDNVRFLRLPRISFSVNRRFYVFPRHEQVELTCHLSGVDRENPMIDLDLIDVMGNRIAGKSQRVTVPTEALRSAAVRPSTEGPPPEQELQVSYAGSVTFKPDPPGYGFYRVRATYFDKQNRPKTNDATFVVVEPKGNRKIGEFGWSIKTKPAVPLRDLATLLGDVGVNWLKFPAWYAPSQREEMIDFAKFADRLGTQNITVVGVLDRPPEELEKALGMQFGDGAAGILSEPQLWGPALDGQMTKLSLMVRHWQLGNDGDESFFAIDDLEQKVADFRKRLEGYGQNTKVTLSWNWLYEPPPAPQGRIVWDNVSFFCRHAPTPDELGRLLSHPSLTSTKPWTVIRPLDEARYSVEVRARDLIHQMITAKQQHAPVIFIHEPISNEGLIRSDGTPSDLLLPWRTAANFLTGADLISAFTMTGGSRSYLFIRGDETTLVVWNENVTTHDEPIKERIYLGQNLKATDLWGRETAIETRVDEDQCRYQDLSVGPLPIFLTGIDRGVALWDMSFQFERDSLATKFGQNEENAVTFQNHFPTNLKGSIELGFPETWKVDRREIPVSLSSNEGQRREPFHVALLDTANSGDQIVPVIVELQSEDFHRFKLERRLRVGVPDVEMDVSPTLLPNGELEIEVQLENKTEKPLSFKLALSPADRKPVRRLLIDARPGRTILRFTLPDGQSLRGKSILVRAVEIDSNSPRIVNKSTVGPL